MSLPKSADLATLDYDYEGVPFTQVQTQGSIDTTTLDYDYNAVPFISAQSTVTYTKSLSYSQSSSLSISNVLGHAKSLSYTTTSSYSLLPTSLNKILSYIQNSVYNFSNGGHLSKVFSYLQTSSLSLAKSITTIKIFTQALNLVATWTAAIYKSIVFSLSNTSTLLKNMTSNLIYTVSSSLATTIGLGYPLILSYTVTTALVLGNFIYGVLVKYTQTTSYSLSKFLNLIKSYTLTFIDSIGIGRFRTLLYNLSSSQSFSWSKLLTFLYTLNSSSSLAMDLGRFVKLIYNLVSNYSISQTIAKHIHLVYNQATHYIIRTPLTLVLRYISNTSFSLKKYINITLPVFMSSLVYILGQSMIKPITIQFTKFYQKGASRATKLLGNARIRMLGQGRNRETKE